MGVDYYSCSNCSETFPDCGSYVQCECGEHWCSDECAEEDGFRIEEEGFTPEGSRWSQETSCKYCRKEDFSDLELLNFILGYSGFSRQEVIEKYKKAKTKRN